MGVWRRLIVDDMIPVDKNDTPLLPRTERDFELWPMLLAKAMMKLAAMSWTNEREINGFYPVSCFTGWVCLPLLAKSLSVNDKWRLLTKYANRVGEVEVTADKQTSLLLAGKEATVNDKGKKQGPVHQKTQPKVTILANISNTTEPGIEAIPGVTPFQSHLVYIDKLKDVNLDTGQMRWKTYRYFDWASEHGIQGNGPGPGVRSLKLIIPLKGCSEEGSGERASKVSGQIASENPDPPDGTIGLPETGVWADFGKISPHLDEILMFYRPSDFEYYARVSDLLPDTSADGHLRSSATGSRAKSQTTGGKDVRKSHTVSESRPPSLPAFRSSLKWQQTASACENEPLYMLVDSMDAKFFLIDFSSIPEPRSASHTSHLIIQRQSSFERSTADDSPTALISTSFIRATIFEVEPGRHLYRVMFTPGHSYFARIFSDTIFYLGDRFRVHDLMTSESDRVDAIAKNISNRLSEAFQEFGKPDHADRLKAFYNSYTPLDADMERSNVERRSVKHIHRVFIDELERVVKEKFPTPESEAICHALRVFFVSVKTRDVRRIDHAEFSTREKAAVTIQSFFRMTLVKIYKNIHSPSHARHSEVFQSLRKVVELFNYSKRESVASSLIRKVISSVEKLSLSIYPCRQDLDKVLHVEEWKGVLRNVQPGQWVPILRVVLNTPTPEAEVHADVDFATNLPKCVIRMVNNETYREVKRLVNRLATARYPHVEKGYTLAVYGWSDGLKLKEVEWSVRVTTVKGQPTFRQISGSKSLPLGSKPPSLLVHELCNNYIPNVQNLMGKWTVKVSADGILSFRLWTSYEMVESVMRVSDKDGNVLCQAVGGSVLILPAVHLSHISRSADGKGDERRTGSSSKSLILDPLNEEDNATTEYHVRAYVANDSWPLTSMEWTVASEAKARGTVYDPMHGRTSASSISKRSMKARVSGRGSEDKLHGEGDVISQTISQHPLCRLQVMVDVGAKVQVEQDRSQEREIAGMKRSWEDEEPGRLLRGRELRDEFIKANSILQTTSTSSFQEPSPIGEVRTLKPPSSLPAWNITAFVSKADEEEEERWVKTEGDEEMLRNQRAINRLDFDDAQATNLEDEIALVEGQRRRYSELLKSYMKKLTDWKSLADAALEKRDNYVAHVKSALSSGASKTADKETTASKKMKKKKK